VSGSSCDRLPDFQEKKPKIRGGDIMNVIEIENLTKKFKIPHEKRTTLFENILGIFQKPVVYEDFYALKNINLKIRKGEFIGIAGPNGSGKTVLLKIISKILVPTTGQVKVRGKIAPFFELGVGFQDNLTAMENVYLYGAIMGIDRKEMNSKFDEIIEFSGLRRFVDMRLKDFSDGMRLRLAFSTGIQTNSDIYLMDEVMYVGDHEFFEKCLGVFKRFKKEGKTLIMVSHDLDTMKIFCEKTLFLRDGEIAAFGRTKRIADLYLKYMENISAKKALKNCNQIPI
jgi:lipopolysaccharide transport system ATP-binding protein